MQILVDTQTWNTVETDWLVIGVPQSEPSEKLPAPLTVIDDVLGGLLSRLRESEDLSGKFAETLAVHDLSQIAAKRLLLVGLGKAEDLDQARLSRALVTAARQISAKKDRSVAIVVANGGEPDLFGMSVADWAQTAASAMRVGCVGQGLYRTEPERFEFGEVRILAGPSVESGPLEDAVQRGTILGEAINLTRELVNRPASDIFPASFAARAQEVADEVGLTCTILDEQQLAEERMNAMLAVASGSSQRPRLVVLEYRGADDDVPALGLVGKGVTFDSGGLSLKPSESMATMKCDMAGAATVLGTMTAIARLQIPVNVTGFMGLVENMPSGSSYKLGDILTARNGVTIEVLNTDAEGRLVLADVLSYAVDRSVERLIDLATLTGACVVALGENVTGVFTNNEEWRETVTAAAQRCGEDVWQLPMFEHFAEQIKSDVADVKNVGGKWGGAITAAKFLEKFVGDTPWVHLDIAGPAFASSNKPYREAGATGCMLHTLVETADSLSKA